MLYAFTMTPEVALEFYKRIQEFGAETEEERTIILIGMVEEGLITSFTATERSREQYIEDLSKNFNVLRPKKEEKGEN